MVLVRMIGGKDLFLNKKGGGEGWRKDQLKSISCPKVGNGKTAIVVANTPTHKLERLRTDKRQEERPFKHITCIRKRHSCLRGIQQEIRGRTSLSGIVRSALNLPSPTCA